MEAKVTQFVVAKDVSEAWLSMTVDEVSEVSKLPEGTAGGVSFSVGAFVQSSVTSSFSVRLGH